jgi:hypothetical protein
MKLHALFAPGITHPRNRTTAWHEMHADLRAQYRKDEIARLKTKRQIHLADSNQKRQQGANP